MGFVALFVIIALVIVGFIALIYWTTVFKAKMDSHIKKTYVDKK